MSLTATVPLFRAGNRTCLGQNGEMNTTQFEKVGTGRGFFAALDQSGGSTPGALAKYGIARDRYLSLIHI